MVPKAKRIVSLAARHRIPAIGGLMSYRGNQPALFRRAAEYVDRLLKGANPVELAVNLKTAKALGLTVPPAIQARAEHLVE